MKNKVIEYLENLDDDTLIQLHNDRCDTYHFEDDRIYLMSDLDDLLYNSTPTEIIDLAGGINTNDDYIIFTIFGVESFDNPLDHIDLDDLADYIIDEDIDNDDMELRDILDSDDDDSTELPWDYGKHFE